MKKVGDKIKEIRIAKGISQEELAAKSKVSVRTIQRIEKHENTPHGKTLQLICESLNILPEDILEYNQSQDLAMLSWIYFSILSYLFIPLGNILLPLILWFTNKNKIRNADKLGRHIVYNQIIISAITYPIFILLILGKINHQFNNIIYIVGIILFGVIHMLNSIYAIYSGIRASKGYINHYPFFRS